MTTSLFTVTPATFPEVYERMLVGPLFRPFAESLLKSVELTEGDRLVDIACGTGIVARLAKEKLNASGSVVGIDMNPGMLGVARSVAPGIDWREGNAMALPVPDSEQFSVATCHQGMQFFPDKAAGAREMKRVLVSGGRVGVATWRPVNELPVLLELQRIAERHVGAIVDQRHSFGEPAPLEQLLIDAGFRQVRVSTVSHMVRFSDGNVFVKMNAMALVGMSAAGKEMSDSLRAQTVEQVMQQSAQLVAEHSSGGEFEYELSTNIATGVR